MADNKIDVNEPATSAPTPETPSATVSTIPIVESGYTRQTVRAKAALGLEEEPSVELKRAEDAAKKHLAPTTAKHEPKPAETPTTAAEPANKKAATKKTAAAVTAPAAKPAETPPAATPAAKPAETPPAPPPPIKVKIAGKEYTVEELEAELAAKNNPPPPPAPVPETPKQAEAPPQLTPEQIAEREKQWVDENAKEISISVTPQEMEGILVGGEESVAAMQALLSRVAAQSLLLARKTIYTDLNERLLPRLEAYEKQLGPVVQEYEKIQRHAAEQSFLTRYPDFQVPTARNKARQVAEALRQQYPEQVARLSQDQFDDEVARQTDRILTDEFKTWHPDPSQTWRTFFKAPAPPAATPAAAAPPAVPAAAPAAAPEAPAAAPSGVKPPVAHSPAAMVSGTKPDWHKQVNQSLRV